MGGHLTPALALLQKAIESGDKVLFVGRKFTSRKYKIPSREKSEVEKVGASFVDFDAPKIERHSPLTSLLTLPKMITAVIRAKLILRSFKPDVVVSFGGYLSVPMAVAAKSSGVPVIIHEQTRSAGLANQLVAKVAEKVAISWPESQKYFPRHKLIVTGNLIRKGLVGSKPVKPDWAGGFDRKPILYVTGGNQGSVTINRTIGQILYKLTKRFNVVHQCGSYGGDREFTVYSRLRSNLKESERDSYVVRSWLTTGEVSWVLRKAELIVSRSGANTVSEIIAARVPAIFVPIPITYKNEQMVNARALEKRGAAEIIEQKNLTAGALWKMVVKITRGRIKYVNSFDNFTNNSGKAVGKLYKVVKDEVEKKKKIKTKN